MNGFWRDWRVLLAALAMAGCGPETDTLESASPPEADTAALEAEEDGDLDSVYGFEALVPKADLPFHGIHGLTFDQDGRLLVGSVVGQKTYVVDPETGDAEVLIPPPMGMADDIEQAPDGTLAWTGFSDGKLYAQKPDGPIEVIARGLPGVNSLAFTSDNRLFFTQVFAGDALYEADLSGRQPPRKLMENLGGLNGFDFGPDGRLYGPLWFKGQIVAIDVETKQLDVIADGFEIPAAVNFNSKDELYAVDTKRGDVVRVDVNTGEKTVVATVAPAIDNLAFSADDRLFITVMADNAILEINVETGAVREVTSTSLAVAGDITLIETDESAFLYVADVFAIRKVDMTTGEVLEIGRMFADPMDYPIHIGHGHGKLVLSSWASGSLQIIDLATEETVGLYHNMGAIGDAVPTADGVLYLDVAGGTLVHASGIELSTRKVLAKDLVAPDSLILVDERTIYVTETLSGSLTRIDLGTEEDKEATRTVITSGLQGPEGLALAPDGSIIVAEVGRDRIVSINPETGQTTPLEDNLAIGLPGASSQPPAALPTGVAVRRNGDIIFSSDENVAIYILQKPENRPDEPEDLDDIDVSPEGDENGTP